MTYTEFDKTCDEAALGYSFSRRTRLIVWLMKKTWPLWRRSARAKAFLAEMLAETLVKPCKSYEDQLREQVDGDLHVVLHTSDPDDPDQMAVSELDYKCYARGPVDGR